LLKIPNNFHGKYFVYAYIFATYKKLRWSDFEQSFKLCGLNKAKNVSGSALPHLGITSLALGDPRWGAPTKKKNLRALPCSTLGLPRWRSVIRGGGLQQRKKT
jgi:hypothetical protein